MIRNKLKRKLEKFKVVKPTFVYKVRTFKNSLMSKSLSDVDRNQSVNNILN